MHDAAGKGAQILTGGKRDDRFDKGYFFQLDLSGNNPSNGITVFDPKGGYWQPGGKFMPSTIAELGYVIERHLQSIGLLKKPELDVHQRKLVQEKRAEFEARTKQTDAFSKSHFPEGAQLCAKCSTAAVVMMDGCNTCLNCGDSKCG